MVVLDKKKLFVSLVSIFINATLAYASPATKCFLMKENDNIIQKEGADCQTRHTPGCSFNIALSLMGYTEEILVDDTHPEWTFKDDYADLMENWKEPHHPSVWIEHSCLWYSHVLVKKMGTNLLKKYVKKFRYGNQDLSGPYAKDTDPWHSTLKISPEEQIDFIRRFLANKLPISARASHFTKKIIFIEDLGNGWQLYGKTGAGDVDKNAQYGWFVGWIQKGDRTVAFAHYFEDDVNKNYSAGKKAKELTRERIKKLIKSSLNSL